MIMTKAQEIRSLLTKLKKSKDQDEKRKIRQKLRDLGYRISEHKKQSP